MVKIIRPSQKSLEESKEMKAALNTSNPSIKRILSEVKKLVCAFKIQVIVIFKSGSLNWLTFAFAYIQNSEPSIEFEAHPVEDNLFDWHFVIRGPEGIFYTVVCIVSY